MDLTEAEEIKKVHNFTKELYKKGLNDPDNHDGVVIHLEPDILECKVKQALEITEKRKEVKGKGEKERYIYLNAEFQRIAGRDKKAFFSDQCKEMKTTEWERLEISSRKLEIPREHFMQRWTQ